MLRWNNHLGEDSVRRCFLTLAALLRRLKGLQRDVPLVEAVGEDFDAIDEVVDEWEEEEAEEAQSGDIDPADTFYRVDHALAAHLIQRARERSLEPRKLTFDYRGYGASIAVLAPYVGRSGTLGLGLLKVESLEAEEFLVFTAHTDDGHVLDADWCRRLLRLTAKDVGVAPASSGPGELLEPEILRCLKEVENRNGRYFDAEVTKLDRWSEDLKLGLERELKDLDAAIRDARKVTAVAVALADKLAAQREIKTLEQKRNRKRRDLYEEQDRIDEQRAELIAGIERQLATKNSYEPLFTIRWSLT